MNGYLLKKGGEWRPWKRRWFVLHGPILTYYKAKADIEPLGQLDLRGSTVKPSDKRPYSFSVDSKPEVNRRSTYLLACSSQNECQKWIEALVEAMTPEQLENSSISRVLKVTVTEARGLLSPCRNSGVPDVFCRLRLIESNEPVMSTPPLSPETTKLGSNIRRASQFFGFQRRKSQDPTSKSRYPTDVQAQTLGGLSSTPETSELRSVSFTSNADDNRGIEFSSHEADEDHVTVARTLPKRKTQNPIWEEAFLFKVPDDTGSAIAVDVYDWIDFSEELCFGSGQIPLPRLAFGSVKEEWYALYTTSKNRRSGDFSEVDAYSGVEASDDRKRKVGEIKVSFEFRDIDLSNPGQHATFLDRPLLCAGAISRANNRKKIGELKVQVLEGRHLLSCDINGLSDPYATIRLGHQERWTETVYENLNPTWRRGTFTLEVSEIMDSLWIELWDEDRYSHDNRIGVVALPLVQLLRSGPSVLWYQVYPAPTDKRPMRLVERAEKPAKTLGYVRISTSFTIAAPLPVCMSAPPPLYPVVRTASIDEVSVRALTKFIADVVRNVERLERCVAPLFNSVRWLQDIRECRDRTKTILFLLCLYFCCFWFWDLLLCLGPLALAGALAYFGSRTDVCADVEAVGLWKAAAEWEDVSGPSGSGEDEDERSASVVSILRQTQRMLADLHYRMGLVASVLERSYCIFNHGDWAITSVVYTVLFGSAFVLTVLLALIPPNYIVFVSGVLFLKTRIPQGLRDWLVSHGVVEVTDKSEELVLSEKAKISAQGRELLNRLLVGARNADHINVFGFPFDLEMWLSQFFDRIPDRDELMHRRLCRLLALPGEPPVEEEFSLTAESGSHPANADGDDGGSSVVARRGSSGTDLGALVASATSSSLPMAAGGDTNQTSQLVGAAIASAGQNNALAGQVELDAKGTVTRKAGSSDQRKPTLKFRGRGNVGRDFSLSARD